MTVTVKSRYEIDAKVIGGAELKAASKSMGALEKNLGGTAAAMVKGQLAAGLLTKAFQMVTGSIGGMIDKALTWNDWIGENTAAVDEMSSAISGLTDKMVLSQAQSKLQTGEFAATQAQLNALAKASVLFARINHTDVAPSIKKITDALVAGAPTGVFRKLGIDMQFTGTQSERTAEALRLLEVHFGDVAIEASNVNERMQQVDSAFANAIGQMGHAIVSSELVGGALSDLTAIVRGLSGDINDASAGMRRFATDILPLMGLEGSSAEAKLLGAASAVKKLQAQTKALKDEMQSWDMPSQSGQLEAWWTAAAKGTPTGEPPSKKGGKGKPKPDNIPGQAMPAIASQRAGEEAAHEAALAGGEAELRKLQLQEEMNGLLFDEKMLRAELMQSKEQEQAHQSKIVKDMERHNAAIDQMDAELTGMAVGGLNQLAAGMFSAADAAISMGKGYGEAVAMMVKQTLLGVAQEAAIQALKYTAIGFGMSAATFGIPNPGSAAAFTAAGIWAGIAAGAGAGGLGISAAMSGGGGGGGGGGSGRGTSSTYRPNSVQGDKDQIFEPTINIYLGEGDASLATHLRKKLKAELELT